MNEHEKEVCEWFKALRQENVEGLQALEGGMVMRSNDGTGWKDITQEQIDRLKSQIAELDRLIEAYERQDAQRP